MSPVDVNLNARARVAYFGAGAASVPIRFQRRKKDDLVCRFPSVNISAVVDYGRLMFDSLSANRALEALFGVEVFFVSPFRHVIVKLRIAILTSVFFGACGF